MAGDLYTPAALTRRLVGFDTTSRESNLDLIRFVEDYLAGHGVASRLSFDDSGAKANLFATLGPQGRDGGIVLSGHSDVVPVDGQDWDTDPFEAVEKDGRLYGRGACDMKGFIATALALVPEFLERGPATPVHLALTFDEEVSCAGAQRLVEDLAAFGVAPRCVIIGEPTSMKLVNAHKGLFVCETAVAGHEAHASLTHRGVNAIAVAARLIGHLAEMAEALKAGADPECGFEPPHTSLNIGTIAGGTQFNIVARDCRFDWEFRPLPGEDPRAIVARFEAFAESLLPAMRAVAPEAGITNRVSVAVPAFAPEPDSPAETLVMSLAGTNETMSVAFGTEAPVYQQSGMSVVVFGPGSIEQAHKPNEFIELSQLNACEACLRKLIDRVAAD